MWETIAVAGLFSLIAGTIGGGLRAAGIEFPAFTSVKRQVTLGVLGFCLMLFGLYGSGAIEIPKFSPEPSVKKPDDASGKTAPTDLANENVTQPPIEDALQENASSSLPSGLDAKKEKKQASQTFGTEATRPEYILTSKLLRDGVQIIDSNPKKLILVIDNGNRFPIESIRYQTRHSDALIPKVTASGDTWEAVVSDLECEGRLTLIATMKNGDTVESSQDYCKLWPLAEGSWGNPTR